MGFRDGDDSGESAGVKGRRRERREKPGRDGGNERESGE